VNHAATGLECHPHVTEPGHRIGEEHRTKAREDEIECVVRQRYLCVTAHVPNVRDAMLLSFLLGDLKERIAAIDTDNFTPRSDQSCKLNRRIPEPTANIENTITLPNRKNWEDGLAMLSESAHEDMPKPDEFRRKHRIPESYKFRILRLGFYGQICVRH
jgi:hypothetical protein